MNFNTVWEIVTHISDIKHIQLWQWVVLAGSVSSAFGTTMYASNNLHDAINVSLGIGAVALAHLLMPSGTENKEKKNVQAVLRGGTLNVN